MFTKNEDFVQMAYGTEGIRKIPIGANTYILSELIAMGNFSDEQRAHGMTSVFMHAL
jgi:hypothetical protein